MSGQQETERAIRKEHDSMDDFEHLEEDVQEGRAAALPQDKSPHEAKNVDDQLGFRSEYDAMTHQQPSLLENRNVAGEDPKTASILLLEAETGQRQSEAASFEQHQSTGAPSNQPPVASFTDKSHDESPNLLTDDLNLLGDDDNRDVPAAQRELPQEQDLIQLSEQDDTPVHRPTAKFDEPFKIEETIEVCKRPESVEQQDTSRETTTVCPPVLPIPNISPSADPPSEVPAKSKSIEDNSWSVIEKAENVTPAGKPEQQPAKEADLKENNNRYERSNDFVFTESLRKVQGSASGESEFESEPEASPAKIPPEPQQKPEQKSMPPVSRIEEIEIAPKEIFRSIGIDAWFNPERLNPEVAALIYWRDPKISGIVFGAILGVLLSLAYFSLISVLAYLSLIALLGTVSFRIYKTILQAVQKTSDGHPFKDILEADLTVPAEKVHEVADVAVAYANAAVVELRRLFLVEDFVDSVKFGVLLWSSTYVGSWFNGMTLIIMGVVALFTLPKVYETNKAQIDQNLALVHGKINELTTKVKAAIPLGKKPEPTKEE